MPFDILEHETPQNSLLDLQSDNDSSRLCSDFHFIMCSGPRARSWKCCGGEKKSEHKLAPLARGKLAGEEIVGRKGRHGRY